MSWPWRGARSLRFFASTFASSTLVGRSMARGFVGHLSNFDRELLWVWFDGFSSPCLSLRVENRTSVLHVSTSMSFMGLTGWGGVGWGNNVHLHCLIYMMLRCCTSSCTSSHTWCYAAVRRLALPHIYDATLVYVVLHFLTYMMQRYCMSSCTSSHIWCYASLR